MRNFLGQESSTKFNSNSVEHAEFTKEIRSKVVSTQVGSIYRLVPAMMVVNLAMMTAVVFVIDTKNNNLSLNLWSLLLLTAIVITIKSWWLRSTETRNDTNSDVEARNIVIATTAFSLLWALLPVVLLNDVNSDLWHYTGTAIVAMVCGAGFALAAMPRAVVGFMVPVLISTTIFAIQGYQSTGAVLAVLMFIYMCFSVITSIAYTRSLAEHTMAQAGVDEQRSVIGLLLKDFEENTSDWLWETDENYRIKNASKRFVNVVDMTADELNGLNITEFANPPSEEFNLTVSAFVESIRNNLTFRDKTIPVKLNGKQYWWSITGKPTYDNNGQFIGFKGVCSDITVQRESEERVKFLAHNDALTGLVNRAWFTEQLNQYVSRLERYGTPFSVLYIDLDRFKAVNDSKGHPVGDKLLAEVGRRLKVEVRNVDILARIGGDEFAVIIDPSDYDNCEAVLSQRIIESMTEPFEIDGELICIGASIGIARAPVNGTRPDQILRNADLALYRAKEAGKGVFQFFKSEMDSEARERRTLESELRDAMVNGEFELYYQPLLDAQNKMPTGFEALIRWNHPIRGLVSPAEFIPLAEKTGMIVEIGEWVIHEACETAADWPDKCTIAVNLSVHQFSDNRILEVVKSALESSGLDAARLELEVTESLLIEQPDAVIQTLMELKALGVAIAMDDFGTGYSSLSYLMKFPFDKMKIDRSFVVALDTDGAARDILKTIGSLGESLKMKITVEGVETSEQVDFLSKMSCHHLQGYYFAKPLQKEAIAGYLLNQLHSTISKNNASTNAGSSDVAMKIAS